MTELNFGRARIIGFYPVLKISRNFSKKKLQFEILNLNDFLLKFPEIFEIKLWSKILGPIKP